MRERLHSAASPHTGVLYMPQIYVEVELDFIHSTYTLIHYKKTLFGKCFFDEITLPFSDHIASRVMVTKDSKLISVERIPDELFEFLSNVMLDKNYYEQKIA